jgi:hypothetical protein
MSVRQRDHQVGFLRRSLEASDLYNAAKTHTSDHVFTATAQGKASPSMMTSSTG